MNFLIKKLVVLKTRVIKKFLKNYDHVIVCDFGHGLIDNKLADDISKKSNFLSLNVQTNSGNRGFNLFTKYKKADLLCIDRHEVVSIMVNLVQ